MKPCEKCGAQGERITSGKFAGDYVGVGYCAFCSADLCRSCMTSGTCLQDGERRPHREEADCEACAGVGRLRDSDTNELRKCLDCEGTGTVLL